MGKDDLGRDVFSRLLLGARVSLLVAVSATLLSLLIGLPLGTIAGYYRGWVDESISRVLDIFLAFPGILLAMALVAVLQPGLWNVVIALGAIGWTGYARLVRGQVLKVREMDYVTSSRAIGARDFRVLSRHILPNILNPILVQATLGMAGIIISEAGLSFLGLGVTEPTPSWGAMLHAGAQHLERAPHLALFPGIAIMLTVLSFNFLGDGLRDWLDPRTIVRRRLR